MSGKKSDEKVARSRGAANDKETPSPKPLTSAEMLAAMTMADCGTDRREELTTAVTRNERPTVISQARLLASRDCNVEGTEAAEKARANHSKLKGWGNVATLSDSDDDGKEPIAGGQIHRAHLREQAVREAQEQQPSRSHMAAGARQLHGPTRLMNPARALVCPKPGTATSAATPSTIGRPTANPPPPTKQRRRRPTPPRNQQSRSAPTNSAWAPENLYVNPDLPLNLFNPSVTTSKAEIRRRLGPNFIELEEVEPEKTTTVQNDITQSARVPVSRSASPTSCAITEWQSSTSPPSNPQQPVQANNTKAANPFRFIDTSTATKEEAALRGCGSSDSESAAMKASIAPDRATSWRSNPFHTTSPVRQPQIASPAIRSNNSVTAGDKLMELVDGRLRDFHITKKCNNMKLTIPEESDVSEEVDLIEFEKEIPNLLDTLPENMSSPLLEPTIPTPSTSSPSNLGGPPKNSSPLVKATHTDEVVSTTPAALTVALIEPLPYMGATSTVHQQTLSSSEAFWKEHQRQMQARRLIGRQPAPASPRRPSLNASRWAVATHTPQTNDNA